MSKSKAKLRVANEFNDDQLREQPLFAATPARSAGTQGGVANLGQRRSWRPHKLRVRTS
ncbi:MAG: hypothetical protein WCI85_09310 [Comamonadaceae bacterium]